MGSSGNVFGIDHIKQLVDKSILNIKKGNSDLLTSGVVQMLSRYYFSFLILVESRVYNWWIASKFHF